MHQTLELKSVLFSNHIENVIFFLSTQTVFTFRLKLKELYSFIDAD